jgi:hypothetical protein
MGAELQQPGRVVGQEAGETRTKRWLVPAFLLAIVVVGLVAYRVGRSEHAARTEPSAMRVAEIRDEPPQRTVAPVLAQATVQGAVPMPSASAAPGTLPERADDENPPELSALDRRDMMIAGLESSGPGPRLVAAAARVAKGWNAKLAAFGAEGGIGAFTCFAKGCYVTAQHSSEPAANAATNVITRTGEFNGWQSGKMRSGVIEKPDGKVEVTWVLFAPEPKQEPLLAVLPPDTLDELKQAPGGVPPASSAYTLPGDK